MSRLLFYTDAAHAPLDIPPKVSLEHQPDRGFLLQYAGALAQKFISVHPCCTSRPNARCQCVYNEDRFAFDLSVAECQKTSSSLTPAVTRNS